jgi:hypothetical protein
VRLVGLGKLKKKFSELDPATFRLVTQCLNQLRYRVLYFLKIDILKQLPFGSDVLFLRIILQEDWFKGSKVSGGRYTYRHTDIKIHTQQGDLSLLLFLQIKKFCEVLIAYFS